MNSLCQTSCTLDVFQDFLFVCVKVFHFIYPQCLWCILMHKPCGNCISFSSELKTVIPPVAAPNQVRIFPSILFQFVALQALSPSFHSTRKFNLSVVICLLTFLPLFSSELLLTLPPSLTFFSQIFSCVSFKGLV